MPTNGASHITPQDQAELADRFWGGTKSIYPDRGWSLLSDQERVRLVEERMREAEARTAAANNGASQSSAQRMFAATQAYVARSHQDLIKQLPSLIQGDLSEIVRKAIQNEVHYIEQRQREQATRQDERLDSIAGQIAKLRASDGASRASALELFISELQAEVRRQGQEIAELKARLR